ncbi:MAG: hypothetical protein RSC06_00715 [Clostridia bacterium]
MKKVLSVLFLSLLLCLFALPALAEATGVPTDFFNWEIIGTFAGAVALTVFIVQAVKLPLDKVFGHVPTRAVVYAISLAVMVMAQWFTNGKMTVETVCMCVVNAFLVMLSAMAAYTELIQGTEDRKLEAWAETNYEEPKKTEDTTDEVTEENEPPTQGGAA